MDEKTRKWKIGDFYDSDDYIPDYDKPLPPELQKEEDEFVARMKKRIEEARKKKLSDIGYDSLEIKKS